MIPPIGAAANVFNPSDSDWVVSFRYRDGVERRRRVCPGTVTEQQAIDFALAAEGRAIYEVEWMAARRASDKTLKIDHVDQFIERMRRLKA